MFSHSKNLHPLLVSIRTGNVDTFTSLAKDTQCLFSAKDFDGRGAVLTAIAFDQADILHKLISPQSENGYGLSLDVKDNYGNNPVLTAVIHERFNLLKRLTNSPHNHGYGLSIKVTDKDGNDAVLLSVGYDKPMMLKILTQPVKKGGYGLSIKSKNNQDYDVVLASIANGHMNMLKQLLKSEKKGGYGCKLKSINQAGSGAVLTAIGNGQLEILKLLLTPKDMGGYGLSLSVKNKAEYDPIKMAAANNKLEILKWLVKPKSQDGYELPISNLCEVLELAEKSYSDHTYHWLCMNEFDQLLMNYPSCEKAITWANHIVNKSEFCRNENKLMFVSRYKLQLQNLLAMNEPETHEIELLVNAIEDLSIGEGRLLYAKSCSIIGDFSHAFEYYLSVFKDAKCTRSQKESAGFELASLVLNGYVIITDGKLDSEKSDSRINLSSNIRNEEGINPNIMQQRAAAAFEYLANNASSSANILRKRLELLRASKTDVSGDDQANLNITNSKMGLFNQDQSVEQKSYRFRI